MKAYNYTCNVSAHNAAVGCCVVGAFVLTRSGSGNRGAGPGCRTRLRVSDWRLRLGSNRRSSTARNQRRAARLQPTQDRPLVVQLHNAAHSASLPSVILDDCHQWPRRHAAESGRMFWNVFTRDAFHTCE